MTADLKTWVFLRGLTRESGHWGDFAEQFQQTVPHSRVIMLDLPGNGRLHHQSSPLSVQEMVAYCRASLALRHLAPPYHLLAMSLGAMVAVAWHQAHPIEVAAQVLINTSMRPFNPFYQRLRPQNYALLLRLALWGATPEVWERTILSLTSNQADEAVLPLWLALHRTHPVSRANALRQLVAAACFSASTSAPLSATLVLASEKDRLVSAACSKALARQWRCALALHPSAGHDIPLDDGSWVAEQIGAWLPTQIR